MFKILIVEDDFSTRLLMKTVLENAGYETLIAENGADALDLLDRKHADLILLDVMMPVMDGYEFTRIMRSGGSNIPILMVTARETQLDKRTGFIAGTDDYMVKPVDEEEMLLRIAALLRRSGIANTHRLTVGSLTFDYDSHSVESPEAWPQTRMEMPLKEFMLLFKLLSYPNQTFTRRQLMDEIWDMDSESDERTVDVHINRVRDRFRNEKSFEIITVRGLGYKAVIFDK